MKYIKILRRQQTRPGFVGSSLSSSWKSTVFLDNSHCLFSCRYTAVKWWHDAINPVSAGSTCTNCIWGKEKKKVHYIVWTCCSAFKKKTILPKWNESPIILIIDVFRITNVLMLLHLKPFFFWGGGDLILWITKTQNCNKRLLNKIKVWSQYYYYYYYIETMVEVDTLCTESKWPFLMFWEAVTWNQLSMWSMFCPKDQGPPQPLTSGSLAPMGPADDDPSGMSVQGSNVYVKSDSPDRNLILLSPEERKSQATSRNVAILKLPLIDYRLGASSLYNRSHEEGTDDSRVKCGK